MPRLQTTTAKPGLLRQIGFVSATALVISNMVGSSIFSSTGFMAGDLGSANLILACWAAGALFAIAGALSYSELGINFPSSGGEYVYLTHAFGPEWGFMTGWVSFFAGFSAPIAFADAPCNAGLRDVTAAERAQVTSVLQSAQAALPPAPEGWIIVVDPSNEIFVPAKICRDHEATPWSYRISRTYR